MLAISRLSKRFGPTLALDDVSLAFAPGEIHALLGENGAGKTTLSNILYGLLRPDAGSITLDGRPLHFRRPADAQKVGIGMVHQHFMLVGRLTVAENLLLGHRDAGFWMPPAAQRRRARDAARRFNLEIDPDRLVDDLSVGQRQRVEILKALIRDVSTLILDEPTAVLTPDEARQFFDSLRRLRDVGCRIVFISHKLAEVVDLADRVSVLRGGRHICTEPRGALDAAALAERMVGTRVVAFTRPPRPPRGPPALRLDRVSTAGHRPLRDVSLVVRAGEIVGVAGVDGNGQAELTRVILGLDRPSGGRVEVTPPSGCGESRPSVAHVADDRQREALVLTMSLAENAVLKAHRRPPFSRRGWLRRRAIADFARRLVAEFDIRAPSVAAAVGALSGGNQQKLVVARELAAAPDAAGGDRGPALILAVNPTRGLDVAATNFVQRRLVEAAAGGAAVLLISVDLDEILALADRVCVLYAGRLTDAPAHPASESAGSRFDVAAISRLMAGLPAVGDGVA